MSLEITKRVWAQSKLNGSDKLMLLALADYADADGFCWPGYITLSEMTCTNPGPKCDCRQAKRTMNNLRQSGEILIWEQQGQHGGRGYTNIYLIITGLSEQEIFEIIARRFELLPNEVASVINKKGDIYTTLSHLKRMTCETLLRTKEAKKGDANDILNSQPELKRVVSKAEKGGIDTTRTIMNHHLEPPFKERESRTRTETHFQKLKRIGEIDFLAQNEALAVRLTEICGNPHPKFVVNSERHKLANATAQLLDWHVTIADLDDFITGYWWGNAPPRYDQVTGDWGRFLTNKQQPQKASKNGRHNNKRQNEPQPSQATGLGEWTDEQKARLRAAAEAAGIPYPDDG